ncbi:hypothetical protein VV02_20695 [Luteipulveratus mongoliensis]|uniref:Uncharacterized protein n=1 Tax=Luteipulveratus mongoliensis TaxID=571913 RepID=A0A0K1JM82_9MICO|nr:hypothetical protein VV02_20695 [Luteipulveratus mongoliensis]
MTRWAGEIEATDVGCSQGWVAATPTTARRATAAAATRIRDRESQDWWRVGASWRGAASRLTVAL